MGRIKTHSRSKRRARVTRARGVRDQHGFGAGARYSRFGRGARLIFTTGALNLLNADERAAVVAHQLNALQGGYGVINYWSGAVADLVHRAGRGIERAVGSFSVGRGVGQLDHSPGDLGLNALLLSRLISRDSTERPRKAA